MVLATTDRALPTAEHGPADVRRVWDQPLFFDSEARICPAQWQAGGVLPRTVRGKAVTAQLQYAAHVGARQLMWMVVVVRRSTFRVVHRDI